MVGHTHEDIDQFFSKFSQYLKHTPAHTLPGIIVHMEVNSLDVLYINIGLMIAVQKCYSDVPEALLLEHIFDVKTWISGHLFQLHNHSHPHIFRFKSGESGEVVMHYKDWSASTWEPQGNGIQLFKVYIVVAHNFENYMPIKLTYMFLCPQSTPIGSPSLIKPSLDRLDFTKLSAHARCYRQKAGISEEDQAWWMGYLDSLEGFCQNYRTQSALPIWPLEQLAANATVTVEIGPLQSPSVAPPEYLLSLQRKEAGPHPEVCD
jgi:hypothetical protein